MPFNAQFIDRQSRHATTLPIYELDTADSIVARLAGILNTIPKLLAIGNIDFQTLQSQPTSYTDITNDFVLENSFTVVYEKVRAETELPLLFILTTFLALNRRLEQLAEAEYRGVGDPDFGSRPILLKIEKETREIDPENRVNVEGLWADRQQDLNKFNDLVLSVQQKARKTEDSYSRFENTVGVQYTPFSPEFITNQFVYKAAGVSTILELFDTIKLNNTCVFAASHGFYKILRDSLPYPGWVDVFDTKKVGLTTYRKLDSTNSIVLQAEVKHSKKPIAANYTAVTFRQLDLEKAEFTAVLDFDLTDYTVSKPDLLRAVSQTVNNGVFSDETVLDVKGVFYFPNQTVNKYILSDLILTDPVFSSVMAIKENPIRSLNNTRVYFQTAQIGNITAEISAGSPEGNPPSVRVKVDKSESEDKVRRFQKVLSQLFAAYNAQLGQITEFYRNIGRIDFSAVDEEEEEKEEESENKKAILALREAEPAIFQVGYTRQCPRPVTIVDDEEAEEAEREGKQVLVYPSEPAGGATPKKYICNHEVAMHPGLRENPFSNSKELPFIPCCYETDQTYAMQKLLKGTNAVRGIKNASYKSHVIIPPDSEGVLPDSIESFFFAADSDYEYRRLGSLRSPSSFLYCVLLALNKLRDRGDALREVRESFTKPENRNILSTCFQEQYDKTLDEISDDLANPEVYMDPALYIHLLETVYQVDIFVFSKVRNSSGEMIVPRHRNGYFKTRNVFESVCIFEHLGSESENATYPQCELIVQKTGERVYNYNFARDSQISRVLFSTFAKINTFYVSQKKNKAVLFDLFLNAKIKPVSQILDNCGKARVLNISYSVGLPGSGTDVAVSLYTTPLPPFGLVVANLQSVVKVSLETAIGFCEGCGIAYNVRESSNEYLEGNLNGLIIRIPLVCGEIGFDASALTSYSLSKKIARYVTETAYWLYSDFIKNKPVSAWSLQETVDEFLVTRTMIDPSFQYPANVTSDLSVRSRLLRSGRLVFRGEEAQRRIGYVLRLAGNRDIALLRMYRDSRTMREFYVDIGDFVQHQTQILLQGRESVKSWIDSKTRAPAVLFDEPPAILSSSYFFRNRLVAGGAVFVTENSRSLKRALQIAQTWLRDGYVKSAFAVLIEGIEQPEFTLISYHSRDDVDVHYIAGEYSKVEILILGFREGGSAFYAPLIPV